MLGTFWHIFFRWTHQEKISSATHRHFWQYLSFYVSIIVSILYTITLSYVLKLPSGDVCREAGGAFDSTYNIHQVARNMTQPWNCFVSLLLMIYDQNNKTTTTNNKKPNFWYTIIKLYWPLGNTTYYSYIWQTFVLNNSLCLQCPSSGLLVCKYVHSQYCCCFFYFF